MHVVISKSFFEKHVTAYHIWRYNSSYVLKFFLACGFSCLTGILAQLTIYLPWTPIPITGQTIAVMLSGVLLGRWGGVSQVIYTVVGFAGIPWFAGFKGGPTVLLGPTPGYLFGFIISAYFIGYFLDTYPRLRKIIPLFLMMLIINFIVILGCGTIYLYQWLKVVEMKQIEIAAAFVIGFYPFIFGGIAKTFIVVFLSLLLTPSYDYAKR